MNKKIIEVLEAKKDRSTWGRGVNIYALELVEEAQVELTVDNYKKELLNGADNWSHYSWGGSSLIYDRDIAERLATPSELKRTKNGEKQPNSREEWLDTQARALNQASIRIRSAILLAEKN